MKVETLQSSLGALKRNGEVLGVILFRDDKVVYADSPFAGELVDEFAKLLDDIGFYFRKENRRVDQIVFGYDNASLLIVSDDSYRLIVLHGAGSDLDFIARAGKSFVLDYQMGLFAAQFEKDLNQTQALKSVSPEQTPVTKDQIKIQESLRPATQRISLKAEQGFDQTSPLQPRPKPQSPPYPKARGR